VKRILAKSTLRTFWEKHPDCEQNLKTWYKTAVEYDWKSPNKVKETYNNATIIANNRIVFNIKGNSYRLVVQFNFTRSWAFIRFIGTHKEYDTIDVKTI
jgi:mRNA interferase HigB